MNAVAVSAGTPLTYQDLQTFPDDGRRYELIEGTLIVTPAPGVAHQIVVAALCRMLFAARPTGTAIAPAPLDFVPDPATVLEPDVLVFDAAEVDQPRLTRTPHLVVEVLSPSSRSQDLGSKLLAYAQAGIPSYWVVDPEPPVQLRAFQLEGTEYRPIAGAFGDEQFQAVVPFPVTIVPARLREV